MLSVLMIMIADLAAIPDFQSGAMENWGLTTYRESGLLYDPEKSSPSDKLGITKVIAHELAHQVCTTNKHIYSNVLEYHCKTHIFFEFYSVQCF